MGEVAYVRMGGEGGGGAGTGYTVRSEVSNKPIGSAKGWGGGKWAGGRRKVDKRNWREGMEYNVDLDSLLYTKPLFSNSSSPPSAAINPLHPDKNWAWQQGRGRCTNQASGISNSSCRMQAVLQTVRVIRYKLELIT